MEWSDLIGRTLGDDDHYEIVEELGRGGSGRVYRARDRRNNRDVAIKVLPNDAEDRQGFIRRFEREAQAVEQLHHPNIVAVYDRGKTDELVYLVLQCVTGGTFRSRLGKPLPILEAAGAIIQMAHALHHAHQHDVIHRDVKPSNMLVDAENPRRLLLTDFGIAKITGMRGLTKSGTTIGTPEYMAPEQATGSEVDHRADVYALGCVLYEALTGKPPFTGNTPVSVLYQQVHAQPPDIRAHNAEVPHDLASVVQQALAKRPDERFDSAQALAQALYPFTESHASSRIGPASASDSRSSPDGEAARGGEAEEGEVPATESYQSGQPDHHWGAEGLDAIFPDDPEAVNPAAHTPRTLAGEQPTLTPARAPRPESVPMPERPTRGQPPLTSVLGVPVAERRTLTSTRDTGKPTPPLDLPPTPGGMFDGTAVMGLVGRAHTAPTAHTDQPLPRLTPPQERDSFPELPVQSEHGAALWPEELAGTPDATLESPVRTLRRHAEGDWKARKALEDSRGGRGGRTGRIGTAQGGRKRRTSPLRLVGAAALALVVIGSGVALLNHAGANLHGNSASTTSAGMRTPSSGSAGSSTSGAATPASTGTAGATTESTPVSTPSPVPTATATPLPPQLAISPNPWSLSPTGLLSSQCSSSPSSQTVTNEGPDAISWAWQSSGAPSPSRDNLQYRLNGGSRVAGLPSHASLAAGGTDTLAVQMNCTGRTYTVSVRATDLATGADASFTFTLRVQ